MDGVIGYLNTDLDLTCVHDLTALAAAFKAAGVPPLHVTEGENSEVWYACFETEDLYTEPEPNIAAMVAVVETLDPSLRKVWDDCSRREFNMGYDCGLKPWAFNQGLKTELLGRMAAVGASLRWTLYPDPERRTPNQGCQTSGPGGDS